MKLILITSLIFFTSNAFATLCTWTGSVNSTWGVAGNWSCAQIPDQTTDVDIPNTGSDPSISSSGSTSNNQTCKSLTVEVGGGLSLTHNGGGGINNKSSLSVYGDLTDYSGSISLSGNVALIMTDSGSPTTQHLALLTQFGLEGISFNKSGGSIVTNQTATVGSGNNLIINNFDIPSAFTFEVSNGDVLELSGGAYIDAGTLQLDSGSTTQVDGGSTIVVDGGTFLTTGTNDNPPNPATKALVTWDGSTPWDFNASSGTVDLTGFIFDNMDDNGIQITGTTNLAHFDGGQLTNLSADYTTMIPLNLSTSGSIPGTSTNFGWNWGPNNTPPGNAVAYVLAESSDCAGQTITFMSWFGDFYSNNLPDPQTKVSASDCTINISAADTVVPLTEFIATSNGNSITLTWQTGDTKTFKGFNVLRSLNALANYTQINQSLVQPIIDPSTPHGKYLFTDSNIQNNFNYFYKIQGITPNNKILEFGPVQADKKSAIVFP